MFLPSLQIFGRNQICLIQHINELFRRLFRHVLRLKAARALRISRIQYDYQHIRLIDDLANLSQRRFPGHSRQPLHLDSFRVDEGLCCLDFFLRQLAGLCRRLLD